MNCALMTSIENPATGRNELRLYMKNARKFPKNRPLFAFNYI